MGRSIKTRIAFLCCGVWLGLFPAAHMSHAEEEGATYSAQKIVAESDRALALLADGQVDEANRILEDANQQTILENSYPPDVLRYPNLAFARFFFAREKYDEVIRFAASIANAMNTDTHAEHPYRIEARALHARALSKKRKHVEALPLLRSAYNQMVAHGGMQGVQIETLLSMIVSARFAKSEELLALFAEFYELYPTVQDNPLGKADFAYVMYMQLDHARLNGFDKNDLAKNSERFIKQVEAAEEIPEDWLHFYRGFHGKALRAAGRYAQALPYLQAAHEYWVASNRINYDFYVNAVNYIAVLRREQGTEAALAAVEQVIALAEQFGASDHSLATFVLQKGVYLDNLKMAGAQAQYRKGYAIARRSMEADASVVQKLKARIDTNDAGFADFELAYEFVAVDPTEFVLDAEGETVIRMFFEGRYLELIELMRGVRRRYLENPALYNANVALMQALVGNHIDSAKNLKAARTGARKSLNSGIATNSPLFDLIEIMNKVVVTIKDLEQATDAFGRLSVREKTLPVAQKRVYLAALMHYYNITGDELNAKAAGYRLLDIPPQTGPLTGWDMVANATLLNNLDLILTPPELARYFEQARSEASAQPKMRLYRAWIDFTELLYTPSSLRQEDTLTKLATYHTEFLRMLPDNYPLVANAQLQISYALQWQNRFEDALVWMEKALKTTAGSDGSRSDTVAFLMSAKVGILLQLRRLETAVIAAKSAYDVAFSAPGRSSMVSGVVEMYARAVFDKTSDGEQAAAILAKHIDDPSFLNSLNTYNKYSILRLYAEYLSHFSTTQTAIAALDRAEQTLKDDNKNWDNERSQLLFARSRMLYWDKQFEPSFSSITQSSDLYFGYVESTVGTGATGSKYKDNFAIGLAMHEAAIGWDYAQSLSD